MQISTKIFTPPPLNIGKKLINSFPYMFAGLGWPLTIHRLPVVHRNRNSFPM
jgi:hypothetical protein